MSKNCPYLKNIIFLFITLLPLLTEANMRSPGEQGGSPKSSSPVTSRHIDILHESIHITANKDFATVKFQISYHIRTDKSGKQIPLLFYASEFRENFKVWIDGKPIPLQEVPAHYDIKDPYYSSFEAFYDYSPLAGYTNIYREKYQRKPEELKYFEADLTIGEHVIRVEYSADVTEYLGRWVKNYSVGYELWPAKHWKSFGTLTISIVNNSGLSLQTNLGKPIDPSPQNIAVWNFKSLPIDQLLLYYEAPIPCIAKAFIAISPFGLMLIIGVLLIIIHIILMLNFRRIQPHIKYSWILILGSIILPLIVLISYVLSYELIDNLIGESASHYHGYPFLILFLYPLIMPAYWFLIWLVDRYICKLRSRYQDPTI